MHKLDRDAGGTKIYIILLALSVRNQWSSSRREKERIYHLLALSKQSLYWHLDIAKWAKIKMSIVIIRRYIF